MNLNKEYEKFWMSAVVGSPLIRPEVDKPDFMSDAQYRHMVKNASESNEKKFKTEYAKQEKAFRKHILKEMWKNPEATSVNVGKVPELIGYRDWETDIKIGRAHV